MAADFPSGRKAFPSRINSASNLPGPQLISNPSYSRLDRAEQVRERLHGRSGRDDRSDVQIAIWPAVQPVPDVSRRNRIRREGLIDCRMAQRASNAHGCELAGPVQRYPSPLLRRPISSAPTWLQGRRGSPRRAAQHSPDPGAMRRHLLSVRVRALRADSTPARFRRLQRRQLSHAAEVRRPRTPHFRKCRSEKYCGPREPLPRHDRGSIASVPLSCSSRSSRSALSNPLKRNIPANATPAKYAGGLHTVPPAGT